MLDKNRAYAISNRLSFRERFNIQRFTRGEKAVAEPVVLSHRRIFILPSTAGLFCGATLAVMLLAAIIYNNNPGFILTFLLGSVALVSILHNFRSLAGLRVSLERSAPVFAGETAQCMVRIENPLPAERINIEVSRKGEPPVTAKVSAKSGHLFRLPLHTSRRGWLNPGTITVSSRYPLGLFRAWSPLNFTRSVLVYPKPATRKIVHDARESDRGQGRSPLLEGEDFSGLHEYRAGDSLRKIHWKAYAKGRGLLVKQYRQGQVSDLWFDLERTPGDNLEERIALLCRGILDAERAGLAFGLKLPGFVKQPERGEGHRNACLKALALY